MSAERKKGITSGKPLLLKGANNGTPQMISIGEASTNIKDLIINKRISMEKELLKKEKTMMVDKGKSHAKKRSKREIGNILKAQEREKNKIGSQIEKLKFENNSPLVINLNRKGGVVECSIASDRKDLQWVSFVKENEDILAIGEDGRELVYRAFVFRLNAQQGKPGADHDYDDLVRNKIGERRDLDPFLIELTKKYGKPLD